MNEILRIIENRELYVHIMLFKTYIETEGRTNDYYDYLERDVRQLFGELFDYDDFLTAEEYLTSEHLMKEEGYGLTRQGRKYIERWAGNFEKLTDVEKAELETKLPTKVFDFFKFSENAKTVLSFITQILKLKETIV